MITLVDALACHRLTRLATTDDITAPIRERIICWAYERAGLSIETAGTETVTEFAAEDPNAPKLATVAVCRWCSSVYIGVGIVLAKRYSPRSWKPLSEVLALSSLAALVAGLED